VGVHRIYIVGKALGTPEGKEDPEGEIEGRDDPDGPEDGISLGALDGAEDPDGDVSVSARNLLVVPSTWLGSTADTVTVEIATAKKMVRICIAMIKTDKAVS
jgi:hypothetical protein